MWRPPLVEEDVVEFASVEFAATLAELGEADEAGEVAEEGDAVGRDVAAAVTATAVVEEVETDAVVAELDVPAPRSQDEYECSLTLAPAQTAAGAEERAEVERTAVRVEVCEGRTEVTR